MDRRRGSGRERELPRARAEAGGDEPLLPRRADDGLAVDLLDAQALEAPAFDRLGERVERRVGVLGDEDLKALAAALEVEPRLGADEHDVSAGLACRSLRLVLA